MPESSVAEPPAAPPPSATPASPKTPPPSPGERPEASWLGDIGSELGDMDAGKPPPPKERDEKGKFKPAPKAPEKPVEKPINKPQEKAQEPVKEPEKPAEPIKPVKAADLRAAYDGLKKKVKDELEPEVQRLRSKIQEYETKPPEDTAPILQKLKTLEERNAQLEKHMALVDYEQSQEFSTKYDQPYREMWNRATTAFNQLVVRKQDGVDEMGEPKFTRRPANESDLIELGALPLSELDEKAQAMFGASAPRAIQYIERLRDLASAKQQAVEEAKQKAGEWKSQQTLEFQTRQKAMATAWTDVNKDLQEKLPRAFIPEEGDADDAAAHTKGFALADLLFLGNASLTPEQIEALPASFRDTVKAGKQLSEIEKVRLHALARLRMANNVRNEVKLKKANARIAELEKTLAEYEKSEPSTATAGEGKSVSNKPWDEQIADELRSLDR